MKWLKGVLYFVLILGVIISIAALVAPSEKKVERAIMIKAPASMIYDMVSDLRKWEQWDPWMGLDSTQVREYTGKLGDELYGYSWTSDHDKVGKGSLYIPSYDRPKSIDYKLTFIDGNREMVSEGDFQFTEENGQTKVSWSLTSSLGFPWRIMNFFFEGRIAPDFEEGLSNLKEMIEKMDIAPGEMKVEMISEFGVNYAIIRQKVKMKDMLGFFTQAYPVLYNYARDNGIEPKGPSSAMYYSWDDSAGMESDMCAAIPISEPMIASHVEVATEVGSAKLGEGVIWFEQHGPYTQFKATHEALGKWLTDNNKKMIPPVIEEYYKGPSDGVDSSQYLSHIVYHFEY